MTLHVVQTPAVGLIIRITVVSIWVLGLLGCGYHKPTCPTIPYHPDAARIAAEPKGSHTRIAIYQTIKEPSEILAFYKRELLAGGWQNVSEAQDGMTFDYVSRAQDPPFTISIVMTETRPDETRYTVYLIIAGPFAGFDYWCKSTIP